jgi:hypothetical protein
MTQKSRQTYVAAMCCLTALTALSCQYPLVLVVTNATTEAVSISLRLAAPQSPYCIEPRSLAFIPASQMGRWFREPERRAVHEAAFDQASCSVRGIIPPATAIELTFHPVAFPHYFKDEPEAQLSLKGAAGSITVEGAQLRRSFEERSGAFLLVYRGA